MCAIIGARRLKTKQQRDTLARYYIRGIGNTDTGVLIAAKWKWSLSSNSGQAPFKPASDVMHFLFFNSVPYKA
jgi:hypothetical protein